MGARGREVTTCYGGLLTGVQSRMALISGKVYPTLGLDKIGDRAAVVVVIAMLAALIPAVIASRREPSDALRHV